MIRFIFWVCAHINPIVLVLGSICLDLMLAILAAGGVYLLLTHRPVVRAVLRTAADLARMGTWSALARYRRRP